MRAFARSLLIMLVLSSTLAPALKAQTTLDALVYAHFRYGLAADSSYTPAANQNNFDVSRVHLTVRNQSAGGISTRVTIDVDGRAAASNQLSMRLKFAYVAWHPEGSALTWTFGVQPTPLVGFVEDLWGYRMQGPIAVDRYRYQASSDFGFTLGGAFQEQRMNFDVGVFNGETYAGAPGDNRKDLAGRVSYRLAATDDASRSGGLRLTAFGSLGSPTDGGTRNRGYGMLSYQTKLYTLAAEYMTSTDSTAASTETKGSLLSVFGVYQRPESKVGFMARVDRLDPNTSVTPATPNPASSVQTRLIAGVSYLLAKNVRILVDADVASLGGGTASNAFQAANRSIFFHTEFKF